MHELTLDLRSTRDVKTFVHEFEQCRDKVDVHSQSDKDRSRIANGKSFIGLMSLNRDDPVIVTFYSDSDFDRINRFLIVSGLG